MSAAPRFPVLAILGPLLAMAFLPRAAGTTPLFTDLTGSWLPFDSHHSENVDLGDVDGDGDLDLAVANGGDFGPELLRLYLNDGTGRFDDGTVSRLPSVPLAGRDVDFGDVDGDGDLDLVAAGDLGSPSIVLINLGEGFFADQTLARFGGPLPSWSEDADLADIDGDGDLDLLLTSHGQRGLGGLTTLWLNDGAGRFTDASSRLPALGPLEVADGDFVDVDGDLDLDLVLACRKQPSRLLINQGGGWFADETSGRLPADGPATYDVEAGDVNGDGAPDLVFVNFDLLADALLLNDGAGTFITGSGFLGGDPALDENEADFGDVDGDGDLDLVIAGWMNPDRVLLNDGAGHLTASLSALPQGGALPGAALDYELADVDRDGRLDLVSATSGRVPQDRLLRNTGAIPDAIPPRIVRVLDLPDTALPGPYSVIAEARDNLLEIDVTLVYVVAGAEPGTGVVPARPMTGTGGGLGGAGLFRAEIPPQAPGSRVTYTLTATDRRGNVSASAPHVFEVLAPAAVADAPGAPADRLLVPAPNPFGPETAIDVVLGAAGGARLTAYDLGGHRVRTLLAGYQAGGACAVRWDGRDDAGEPLPSGVYFLELSTARGASVRKIQLLR